MELDREMIRELPKTDLHVHLDGSLRVDTLIDLARKQGVKLPTSNRARLADLVKSGNRCKNLREYLHSFEITLSVMQAPEALHRIAYELAEDAANENIWYMEVRFSPILHVKKKLKLTTIVNAVLEGLQQAEKEFNIKTGIIVCGMRDINPETSLELAELSVAYKNKGVVGFDLAGQEENYPAKHHREAFFIIRKNNINTTAHAGEAFGPESIHQALHDCGAHRIGHGTRLYEDGDLLNYVNDHRIPLEICLTSNIQTGAARNFESHPLRLYYDYGLRVTINTDNRLVSDTTLTEELHRVAKYLNLNINDIKSIIVDGFKSAFLPNRAKSIMLNMVNDKLKKF